SSIHAIVSTPTHLSFDCGTFQPQMNKVQIHPISGCSHIGRQMSSRLPLWQEGGAPRTVVLRMLGIYVGDACCPAIQSCSGILVPNNWVDNIAYARMLRHRGRKSKGLDRVVARSADNTPIREILPANGTAVQRSLGVDDSDDTLRKGAPSGFSQVRGR